MQLDHLTVPVWDYDRSKEVYAEALSPLGFAVLMDWHQKRRAYLGIPPAPSTLWLVESPVVAHVEISLAAADADAVDAFHAAAAAAGAKTVDAPGTRTDRSSRCYAARVVDPDGNMLECVHRTAVRAAA